MLAWLSLNMGLSHELIQNERGCLIYEASPRFGMLGMSLF